jgi:glycosyltransferase involved in cell wall biosynthesis
MKNIVFLNSCPVWGGGEKWTFTTAKILNEDPKFNVYIATGRETELFKRAKEAGIKTKEVKVKSGITVLNPFKSKKFINFLKEKNIDIMFLNMSQDLKFGGITGKIAGLDRIIYRRGLAVPIKDRFYNKFLFNKCLTNVIANSIAVKKSLLKNTSSWFKKGKIDIIYNGVDLERIKSEIDQNNSNLRKEFNIDAEEILISKIGRLTEQKGHKYLFEALSIVKNDYYKFTVLIVGKGDSEKELKTMVSKYNLENHIIFTGFRSDIYNILNQSDFLVHTALWEGCPNTILEAMAVGTPIVASNIPSVEEILINEDVGYLAENKNPKDIASKMIKMIKNANRNQLSFNARKLIEKQFTTEIMVNNIKKIL